MQQSKTAVILAGGRGTRLGSLTDDMPKPLLQVAERPFIFHVLDYLSDQDISNVILATGYLGSQFESAIGTEYKGISIRYSSETSPLGTGGAFSQALSMVEEDTLFVLNGDTLFKADLRALEKKHHQMNAPLSLVVRHVEDTARYGRIDVQDDLVTSMHETGRAGPGYINGGIYILQKNEWPAFFGVEAFSLESEALPFLIKTNKISFVVSNAYFIDIGIPADLKRSQIEMTKLPAH